MAIFSANSISISVSNFISSSSHLSSFTPPTSFIKLAAHPHLQLLLNLRLRLQNSAIDGLIPSGIMLILPTMPALSSYIFQLYLCLHISCICYLQVAPATGIRLHLLPSLPSIPPVFSMKAHSSHMHTSKSQSLFLNTVEATGVLPSSLSLSIFGSHIADHNHHALPHSISPKPERPPRQTLVVSRVAAAFASAPLASAVMREPRRPPLLSLYDSLPIKRFQRSFPSILLIKHFLRCPSNISWASLNEVLTRFFSSVAHSPIMDAVAQAYFVSLLPTVQ